MEDGTTCACAHEQLLASVRLQHPIGDGFPRWLLPLGEAESGGDGHASSNTRRSSYVVVAPRPLSRERCAIGAQMWGRRGSMAGSIRAAGEGAAAGLTATAVMTAWLWVGQRFGNMHEQPHHRIVRQFLPGRPQRPQPGERSLGQVAHLGFGVSTGSLFGLLTGDRRPPLLGGVGYGLLVWAVSYLGWVPLLGIMPPAHRDQPGRSKAVFSAHIPYGAVLALLLRRLRRSRGHLP
ncbi:DUF6789 family protein [Spirillospora sp. NPDC048832]